MNERQIEKCEICNENEYLYYETFSYKGVKIRTRVCEKCATKLMSDEFSRFRTVELRERPMVKVKRKMLWTM